MAQTIRTGEQQVIALLAAISEDDPDAVDNEIIRTEEVRAIAKRRANLDIDVKGGFATLYDQCSQDVKDKLETLEGWVDTQAAQSLHEQVKKIERICVGFDDHK